LNLLLLLLLPLLWLNFLPVIPPPLDTYYLNYVFGSVSLCSLIRPQSKVSHWRKTSAMCLDYLDILGHLCSFAWEGSSAIKSWYFEHHSLLNSNLRNYRYLSAVGYFLNLLANYLKLAKCFSWIVSFANSSFHFPKGLDVVTLLVFLFVGGVFIFNFD